MPGAIGKMSLVRVADKLLFWVLDKGFEYEQIQEQSKRSTP